VGTNPLSSLVLSSRNTMAAILVSLLLSSCHIPGIEAQRAMDYVDIEAIEHWYTPGTCQNLFYDCWGGRTTLGIGEGGGGECSTCRADCEAAARLVDAAYDIPPADYTPTEYCGGRAALERSDCERLNISCYKKCARIETEGQLPACQLLCDTTWFKQCELKREYDLNDGIYDETQCLDTTKWPPHVGMENGRTCCEAIVYDAYVRECWAAVLTACDNECYDLAWEDPDADINACLYRCNCFYGTDDSLRGTEECKSLTKSLNNAEVQVPPSLYVMGTLIAVLLACIAGLLCFGICALPLLRQAQTEKYSFVGKVNEQQ